MTGPKSDLPAVRTAMQEAHRGVVARCPGLALRPRATLAVRGASQRRADLRCDIDCTYALTVQTADRPVLRRRGRAIGGTTKHVPLGSLRSGRYKVIALLVAPVNPGRPRSVSAGFTVP